MDLGLKGKKAIVCASSRGLGKGCALALVQEGVELVINGVTPETLERTAAEIRAATGVTVTPVVADVATVEGRERLLAACPQDLKRDGVVQDAATIRDGSAHCASLRASLFRLLDYLSGPHAHLT